MKQKSPRNKTIDIGLTEGQPYLDKCIRDYSGGQISDCTIVGDCRKTAPLLPEGLCDLIIADPPYNMRKKFNDFCFSKVELDEYGEYTREWISAVAGTLKKTGSIYVCCDWESSSVVGKVLSEFFIVRNRITWQREKGRGAKANWKNGMEDIWFATVGDEYTFNLDDVKIRRKVIAPYKEKGKPKDWQETEEGNFRDTCPSNFWDDITVPFWSMAENTAHPTQKPEKLIARLILASSNPGDIVLDPFLGSGTTSVTARKLNRHYIGIEREEQFCIWAEKRLEMAETDKTIQGFEKGIFFERNSKQL